MRLRLRLVFASWPLVVLIAAVLFVAAGTTDFWPAWVFVVQLSGVTTATNAYLIQHMPDLLERRRASRRETEPAQRRAIALLRVAALGLFVVAGLDHRLRWSDVPVWLRVVAFGVVAAGEWLVFRVLQVNRFASVTVEVSAEQQVVATGPYRWVRHPMYLGALLQAVAIPLALGSFWAEGFAGLACALVVVRLLGEERVLSARLPGYGAYRERTPHRLLPGLW